MKFVKDYAKEMYQVMARSVNGRGTTTEERLICWLPPSAG